MDTLEKIKTLFKNSANHSANLFLMSQKNILPHHLSFYRIGKLGIQMAKTAWTCKAYEKGKARKDLRDTELEKLMALVNRWIQMPFEKFMSLSMAFKRGQIIISK